MPTPQNEYRHKSGNTCRSNESARPRLTDARDDGAGGNRKRSDSKSEQLTDSAFHSFRLAVVDFGIDQFHFYGLAVRRLFLRQGNEPIGRAGQK